jgi:hypothetical protein
VRMYSSAGENSTHRPLQHQSHSPNLAGAAVLLALAFACHRSAPYGIVGWFLRGEFLGLLPPCVPRVVVVLAEATLLLLVVILV